MSAQSPMVPASAVQADSGRLRAKIPSIQSGRWIGAAVGTLLLLSALSWLLSQGVTLHIQTNVPNALIRLDHTYRNAVGGLARFESTPVGERKVWITDRDFAPFEATVHSGWFSARTVSFQSQPLPVSLVVQTLPNAEILLNNLRFGNADRLGRFQKDGLTHGRHHLTIRLPGYTDVSEDVELHPPELRTSLYPAITPERQRQIEENQRQIGSLLQRAQTQFMSRNLLDAFAAVNLVLKLDSSNADAIALRDRIVETMKVLK